MFTGGPHEARHVSFLQCRGVRVGEIRVGGACYALCDVGEEFVKGCLVAAVEHYERHGVGSIGTEQTLVHVDAYAGYRTPDGSPFQLVLDENAADFSHADVDVVGPFDACADSLGELRVDGVGDCERHEHGELELPVHGQSVGPQQHRECEILARLGFP